MKAEITKDGILKISAKNECEGYVLTMWIEKHVDGCTLKTDGAYLWINNIPPEIRIHKRLWLKFLLWLHR